MASWTEGQICRPRASKPRYTSHDRQEPLGAYWPQDKLLIGRKYIKSHLIGKRTPCDRNLHNATLSLKKWADQNGYTVLIYLHAKIVNGIRMHALYIYGKEAIQAEDAKPHYVGITSANGGVQHGWDKRAVNLIRKVG
mgnify:CR=1 FL=1|tara:strand:- start:375 stop:788 length:414 start_codon:yes stop_codon:yes gene_type:complete